MQSSRQTEQSIIDKSKLSVFGGILTIMSTIIGAGMCGVPYAFFELGLYLGTVVNLLVILQQLNSTWLYAKSKDLIPGKPESLYEIGYMTYRRASIFFISFILAIQTLGITMVYFILFADTLASFIQDIFSIPDSATGFEGFIIKRVFWIIILSLCILPICLKKELHEIYIVSIGLFVAVIVFSVIIFI